jgi:5-formyltetrahydrofolate cyclo-ligase
MRAIGPLVAPPTCHLAHTELSGRIRLIDAAETHALKANLRREAVARRKQAHAAHPHAGLALMQHFKQAIEVPAGVAVSGFWPMGEEIDIKPLLAQLHASGHRVGLPVVVKKGEPLIFRHWHPGMALVAGGFGTEVPPPSAPELEPDVLIVPLLAFDAEGYRLGYGGGFYDRTLDKLRTGSAADPLAVGVSYSAQHVARVPRDDFDQPLDWIVTEKAAHHFASVPSEMIAAMYQVR